LPALEGERRRRKQHGHELTDRYPGRRRADNDRQVTRLGLAVGERWPDDGQNGETNPLERPRDQHDPAGLRPDQTHYVATGQNRQCAE
jgi:hypothetical protein